MYTVWHNWENRNSNGIYAAKETLGYMYKLNITEHFLYK